MSAHVGVAGPARTSWRTGAVSIRQVKAARALLAWSPADLAAASGVSLAAVERLEAEDGALGGPLTDELRRALETAGVEFIDGGAPGVRLRPCPGEFFRPDQLTSENDG